MRDDLARRNASLLIDAGPEAVKNLLELMRPPMPPATRLGANTWAVFEIGLKQREAGELTQRIPEFINQIAEAIVEPDPSTESRESTGCQSARLRIVRVPRNA